MNVNGSPNQTSRLLNDHANDLLTGWILEQESLGIRRDDLLTDRQLRDQGLEFLKLWGAVARSGATDRQKSPEWEDLNSLLSDISRKRALQGFNPSETALFVFSLKNPLIALLRRELENDPAQLAEEISANNDVLDKLGLYTFEVYQQAREEVIYRQQQGLMELSTPVVKLWDGILALPIIGTLDSERTQNAMEALLQAILDTNAEIAILDITGVPTVDTLTAQHLLKTVTATRLMGAECIISGIRPQIAQTIVHLGVDLGEVTTKATLADALTLALKRMGFVVSRAQSRS